jgi:hypothetical protein
MGRVFWKSFMNLCASLALVFGVGRCQSELWIYPPSDLGESLVEGEDLVFVVGSTQTLKWQSSYPTANISWFPLAVTGGADASDFGHVVESKLYPFRCIFLFTHF